MAHLLVLVLNNLELCSPLLEAWEQAGVSGITILESSGLGRVRRAVRDDLPLIPSLRDLLASHELHHRTIFSVIQTDETLERAIAATEQVVGDLRRQNTGLLFVLPVTRLVGLPKYEE